MFEVGIRGVTSIRKFFGMMSSYGKEMRLMANRKSELGLGSGLSRCMSVTGVFSGKRVPRLRIVTCRGRSASGLVRFVVSNKGGWSLAFWGFRGRYGVGKESSSLYVGSRPSLFLIGV